MVDKQVVIETIQRMRDSGITDKIIASTLSDIGLTNDEITDYLAPAPTVQPESSAPKTAPVAAPSNFKAQTAPADDESDESDPEAEESLDLEGESSEPAVVPATSENEALHASTHVALEEQNNQIQELLEKFSELDSKLSKIADLPALQLSESITRLDKRFSTFETELEDTKTQVAAFKTVMERLLETNRQILTSLQDKR